MALGVAALASLLLAAALARVMIAVGISDAPDHARKAHRTPTPTGGGLAVGAALGLSVAGLATAAAVSWGPRLPPEALKHGAWVLGGAFAALAIGAADDVRPLGPRLKFGLLAGLALICTLLAAHARYFVLGPGVIRDIGLIAGVLGSALWVFTLINTVNFMDGANGLSMGCGAIGLLGLATASGFAGAWHVVALCVLGAAALAGFLIWNYPHGKLFAGDAGSLFTGALAALAALAAVVDGGLSPLVPPVLFFPLLADVLLTMLWRLRQGRPLLQPHADHVFQIALRAGWSHGRVALVYWLVTAHCAALGVLAGLGPMAAARWSLNAPAAEPLLGVALWLATLAPWIVLAALAVLSIRIARQVRAYAEARGLIAPAA